MDERTTRVREILGLRRVPIKIGFLDAPVSGGVAGAVNYARCDDRFPRCGMGVWRGARNTVCGERCQRRG